MLQNPIHLRLERLESWQHVTFMACLCERMYPNYAMFCKQTEFGDGQIYRRILDLIWETLTVKDAKVNFDSQLEKFEEAIPAADDYDLYGVYPAIDACVALSELMHSRLSGETLEHAIEVSKTSITTVAMLEMTQAGREMTDEELKTNPAVEQEWDIQWEIFRLLAASENLLMEYRMAKPPFGKHALPVSHTHMTAAAMITAAIAAATAIAHSCAAWYASLRHRDIPFHALLI